MTTGTWHKAGALPASPCTVNNMIDNLEQVKRLMTALYSVWQEGELSIDFSEKTFRGQNLHPLVDHGLRNLGFTPQD